MDNLGTNPFDHQCNKGVCWRYHDILQIEMLSPPSNMDSEAAPSQRIFFSMERDIPYRDTPKTFLFIHFNSKYIIQFRSK